VGSELPSRLEALGHEVVPATRHDLDLAAPGSIGPAVEAISPDAVVNCAAYNAVDRAEEEPDVAMAVNAVGVGELAEACAARSIHLVHISTDYVFSGDKASPYDETDEPGPRSEYGRSKLAGEEAVRAAGGVWTVVRTALVFGTIGRSLVELILDRALSGQDLRMTDDQRGSPTHAGDLAGMLAAMVHARVEGLFHVTNGGSCSPFDLATLVADVAGITTASIEAISIDDLGRKAVRPRNSALVSVRLEAAGLDPLRPYGEAVAERVKGLLAARGQA